jgi:hypothetical protein
MALQPRWPEKPSHRTMAPQPINTFLEVLGYLLWRSLDDLARAMHYLDFADRVSSDIASTQVPLRMIA